MFLSVSGHIPVGYENTPCNQVAEISPFATLDHSDKEKLVSGFEYVFHFLLKDTPFLNAL